MNNVVLAGRLTKDAEMDFVGESQIARSRFTLAVDRSYNHNYTEKNTDFIRLEIWGNRAQTFSSRLKKGLFIVIEGSIRVENYNTEDGKSKSITKIHINNFRYIENKSKQYNSNEIFEDLSKECDIEEEKLPF